MEVHFNQAGNTPDTPQVSRTNTPDPEDTIQGETDYTVVLDMVNNLRDKLTALNLDNTNIRAACDALRQQCHSQGVAFGDLSKLVKQSLEGRQYQQAQEETRRPYPLIRPELIDGGDIGVTWQDGDTFLHGVQLTGRREDMEDDRHRPATSVPYPPGREDMEDTRHRPAMSTPYPPGCEHPSCDMSTPRFPRPVCIEMSDTPTHQHTTPRQEGRPGHRPAAPIHRFNNKTIGRPAWFRHFKAVADVHGWDKDQRALQMVSYLDEKAMNVAQELSDRELYDYDMLVKLLSDRFDPASRVSASRSRFHGRTRRHQEDADTNANSITELCRLGYPQSSPELRQELISEQFVRRAAEPPLSPEVQQMFALARRMGYEMRPIACRLDAPRQTPGPLSSPNKEYRTPFRPRDYSRTKCFSCGQLGHTQVRCPKPDSSLPFWPVCHRFGPRFIINRHPRYSPGKFIYLHALWGINH